VDLSLLSVPLIAPFHRSIRDRIKLNDILDGISKDGILDVIDVDKSETFSCTSMLTKS